jgi:hypothetical protein
MIIDTFKRYKIELIFKKEVLLTIDTVLQITGLNINTSNII